MEDIKYGDISVNDIVGDIRTGKSLGIKPSKEGVGLQEQILGKSTLVVERKKRENYL